MKKTKENDKKVFNYIFQQQINEVYLLLKTHKIKPKGNIVNGIFRLENIFLTGIRKRANFKFRHIEENAGRSLKYVENVNYYFRCETKEKLIKNV